MTARNDQNLGPAVLVVAWVFAAVSAVVVITRYYIRLRIVRRFAVDDWLILVTFLLALGNSGFLTVSAHWGLGRHIDTLSPENVMNSIKWVYLCEFFSIMSPGIGRISFASLLLAIIPPVPWRRRTLWTIISIQFVVDCVTVIISFSQCRPIQGFWDQSVPAKCWPAVVQQYTGFFQGSVCSVVDLILAVFPASLFWNLNMEWKQKLSLSCLMGLGVFAMIASIIKTIELRAITAKADATYAMAILAIWWTLEAYLVLIAASIPTLRPIMKPSLGGTRVRTGASKFSAKDSWRASKGMRPGNSTGGFRSLDEPQLLKDDTSNEEGVSYKAGAYPLQGGMKCESGVKMGTIQKDTTIGVTYEERDLSDADNGQAKQPRRW